jgi:hypothetical protein
MDVNATLAAIREITARNRDKDFMSDDDALSLVELFDALDGWLSKGGFQPDEWQYMACQHRGHAVSAELR